ncbi:MAG TPA: LLM class flavin-dependent oxidoreductase [Polyangia bacterium]
MTDIATRQIELGAFLPGPGQHIAAWRHTDAAEGGLDIEYYKQLARTAEQGLFDVFFLADSLALPLQRTSGLTSFSVLFEPVTLYAALSTVTQHLGFVATASTTYEDPTSWPGSSRPWITSPVAGPRGTW